MDSIDHLAHDPFVIGSQIDPPLLQDLHDVASGLRTGLIGELFGRLTGGQCAQPVDEFARGHVDDAMELLPQRRIDLDVFGHLTNLLNGGRLPACPAG